MCYCTTPIVVISNTAGNDGYYTKPTNKEILLMSQVTIVTVSDDIITDGTQPPQQWLSVTQQEMIGIIPT